MNKKILIKTLAIVVILVGLVLLGYTVHGIVQGNRYYDLFRKISVGMKEVYPTADSEGIDQVKEDYRSAFAIVDQIDALGGKDAKQYLDQATHAYGLLDTIEATEATISAASTVGPDASKQYLDQIFSVIDDVNAIKTAVEAVTPERASAYLDSIAQAYDEEDETPAREAVENLCENLMQDSTEAELKSAQNKAAKYVDFVLKAISDKGLDQARQDIEAFLAGSEQSSEELGRQRIDEQTADLGDQEKQFISDVFRLIEDQGSAAAKTYLEHLLTAMSKNGVSNARDYLAQEYPDTPANHETRSYLDGIFSMMEQQGLEYTKQHMGDLCASVITDGDHSEAVLRFQNDFGALCGQVGLHTASKYMAGAFKAYEDKTLRIDELGTDNLAQLEELDGAKLFCIRNKAKLLAGTVALLILGIALLFVRPQEGNLVKTSKEAKAQMGSHHMGLRASRTIANTSIHVVLVLISIIWLIPFICIVLQSLRVESTHQVGYVMPEKLQFYNYIDLFSTDFPRWYLNTFIIALITAALQTVIVLCMSYTLSRFRFKMRKPLMRFMLILGMFPGMLSMIILFGVLKDLNLIQEHAVPGLILVYVASSGMGYYVSKGFFDTLPKSLDEAARVDGATRFQVLTKIILPLSKPIVIYTVLTAFMGPWGDYVFAQYISRGKSVGMNVAVGLFNWLNQDQIAKRYTMFCAGGVLVAIPVTVLFMWLQKYYVEGVTGGAVKG